MHHVDNVFPFESGADSTLSSRQDMNVLSSLVVLSSNIHRSHVLAVSRSEGAAEMLSTSHYKVTNIFRSKQHGDDINRLSSFIWGGFLR